MKTKTETLFINIDDRFDESIDLAKKLFLNGSVFIYPTDTIYGFGGNPFNEETINKISTIKGKGDWRRYIFLVPDIDTLRHYAEIKSEKYLDFLLSIWPNPISVILNLNKHYRDILGMETGGFRIPNHRFCLRLLEQLKMPLISTSVNRTGNEPMNEPSMIKQEFSDEVEAIFYSKTKSFFEASTLIDLSTDEPKLIREGKIKFVDLIKKLG